jgi:hypothetical protein
VKGNGMGEEEKLIFIYDPVSHIKILLPESRLEQPEFGNYLLWEGIGNNITVKEYLDEHNRQGQGSPGDEAKAGERKDKGRKAGR